MYTSYFMADLIIFYVIPLFLTCLLYALIARILLVSSRMSDAAGASAATQPTRAGAAMTTARIRRSSSSSSSRVQVYWLLRVPLLSVLRSDCLLHRAYKEISWTTSFWRIYRVFQKVVPPKTFWNIFTFSPSRCLRSVCIQYWKLDGVKTTGTRGKIMLFDEILR